MNKLLLTIAAVSAVLISTTSQAGEVPVFDKNPVEDTFFEYTGQIDIMGLYGFGDEKDWGYGGGLSFLVEDFIGLRGEYFFMNDTNTHNAFVNVYLQYPLMDNLYLEPYVGVGGWHVNEVRIAGQGGLDLVYEINKSFALRLGGRYIYYDERDDMPSVIFGGSYRF